MPGHRRRRVHRLAPVRAPAGRRPRRRRPRRLHPLLSARHQGSQPGRLPRPAAFQFFALDLRTDDLDDALDGVEVVFHLAAMAGLVKSWTDFDLLRRAATSPRRSGCSRPCGGLPSCSGFIYASTSSVYGSYASGDETLPTRPISPYGVTKLAAREPVPGLRRGARPAAGGAALLLGLRPAAAARHGLPPSSSTPCSTDSRSRSSATASRSAATPTSTTAWRRRWPRRERPRRDLQRRRRRDGSRLGHPAASSKRITGRQAVDPPGAGPPRRPARHLRRHRQAAPPPRLAAAGRPRRGAGPPGRLAKPGGASDRPPDLKPFFQGRSFQSPGTPVMVKHLFGRGVLAKVLRPSVEPQKLPTGRWRSILERCLRKAERVTSPRFLPAPRESSSNTASPLQAPEHMTTSEPRGEVFTRSGTITCTSRPPTTPIRVRMGDVTATSSRSTCPRSAVPTLAAHGRTPSTSSAPHLGPDQCRFVR